MAWNPTVYNKFKNERFAPFDDLLQLVTIKPDLQLIDLGCGTGELTRKLADHLPGANVLGIDSSKEMLTEAAVFANDKVAFEYAAIEEKIASAKQWDLVFSNAALQWIDAHEKLFPKIISVINPGGQLAIQVPANHDHFTHVLLRETAAAEPFKTALEGWIRTSPVLAIDEYAEMFFNHGATGITVYEKVYPHVLENAIALYEWMSGTAMTTYMEKLPVALHQEFTDNYKKQLAEKFTTSPVFYPFKRIIMTASF